MNPCTLGWYLPLLVKDVPGALQPSDDGDRQTLAGPSNARAASSSSSHTGTATTSAVGSGRQASAFTATANPRGRTEFNVSTRGDGTGATTRLARGVAIQGNGARGGGTDIVDQTRQPANLVTAGQDGDVDLLGPPPLTRSSPPRHVQQQQQQRSQRSRHDGRGTQTKQKSLLAGAGGGPVTWKDLDAKFRRDLPDDVYVGRLVYRGLVMRACPRIRMLDGIEVSEKERDKAERLLENVLDRRRPAASSAMIGQQPPRQQQQQQRQ
ncbi:hypothetical protein BDY19DRAFT_170962 [Irpex rosettiformis]|uniref:Uncharacterized protein n=1 Tax=Irpex rosettiformis TaxID=378272 RepID=A0ACB8U2Y6_9APHY|nr:hypothetical protein BDY19DRAFT_170962 [Irpex rosettiformis]